MPTPRIPLTPLERRRRGALTEFTAIAVDVGRLPGERSVAWWVEVREAVCAAYGVPNLTSIGSGRRLTPPAVSRSPRRPRS